MLPLPWLLHLLFSHCVVFFFFFFLHLIARLVPSFSPLPNRLLPFPKGAKLRVFIWYQTLKCEYTCLITDACSEYQLQIMFEYVKATTGFPPYQQHLHIIMCGKNEHEYLVPLCSVKVGPRSARTAFCVWGFSLFIHKLTEQRCEKVPKAEIYLLYNPIKQKRSKSSHLRNCDQKMFDVLSHARGAALRTPMSRYQLVWSRL